MFFEENIVGYNLVSTPKNLKEEIPLLDYNIVEEKRDSIKKILSGEDSRRILILGPCSIHNIEEAISYAKKLKVLSDKVKENFLLVMRLYFEKPRTTKGWKGLISDPDLSGGFEMEKGLRLARKLLIDVLNLGLPTATEFLDPIVPQYIGDLVCWAAIGARTTESQTHRQLASGLSMPVGFKNSTSGDFKVAVNALISCSSPHSFLGISDLGNVCRVDTKGNNFGHVILRGGDQPNYDANSVNSVLQFLNESKVESKIIVDCSHANSSKDYTKQPIVFNDVLKQFKENSQIAGMMLESNLFEGNQKICEDLKEGVSVTDGCIGWDETEKLILNAQKFLQ